MEVYLKSQIDEQVEVHFKVTDTGIGISPENQEKLFKPFTQVASSLTRKYGGAGLGLSIWKCIVEMMNGRIWVESEEGKGASFSFTAVFKKASPATVNEQIACLSSGNDSRGN